MSNWKSWGIYCTMCVEGGSGYGSKKLKWDVVESDYLIPSSIKYGGGVGIIQFTSENYELLRKIVVDGYNMSDFPSGSVKSDLTSGSKTINWFKYSTNGGLFTLAETREVKKMLKSKQGINSQVYFINKYFNSNNKAYMDMLERANIPDKVKAFLINMIVLAPAYIRNILTAPLPQTLEQAKSMSLNYVGYAQHYINRMDNMIKYINQSDLSTIPPIDVMNYDETGEVDETEKPEKNPNIPGDSGGENTKSNNDTNQLTNTTPTITLKDGSFWLTQEGVWSSKHGLLFKRDRDNLFLNVYDSKEEETDDDREQQAEKDKEENESTAQKPNDLLDDDKQNIIEDFIKELLKYPQYNWYYANIRPQGKLNEVGYADCSGYVGWCMRKIFPKVWNNGYVNTGTIYNIMKASGYCTWVGAFNNLKNQTLVRGDILEFSDDNTFGAGNDKHVGVYIGNNEYVDMNGDGNQRRKWSDVLNIYTNYMNFNYACIIKVVK